MNHASNEDDLALFARLEAEMKDHTTPGVGLLDLGKARVEHNTQETSPTGTALNEVADDLNSPPDSRTAVDGPAPSGPGWWARMRAAERRPVLPAWARSRDDFRDTLHWLLGHIGHTAAFHAVRLPWYAVVLTARAVLGLAAVYGRLLGWAWDVQGEPLRQAAASSPDAVEYLKLAGLRDRRVRARWILLLLGVLAGPGGALVLWFSAPTWMLFLIVSALVAVLGNTGTPKDKPIVSRAVVATEVERLTSTVIERALGSLGIAEINKALGKGGEGIRFQAPITRDGPGWRADLDLPYGVTVPDILDRRDRLASGLRRPLGCVWPESVADEHAGRMLLWVGDRALTKVDPPTWPLAKSGAASLFQALPFGTDQRGRPVQLTLMYDNVLIGAMPGMGKTFSLRTPLLAAALDVVAELLVWELKGTGDLSSLMKVAADYGSGADDDTKDAALDSIRYVHRELERRAKVIASLHKDKCPENKVTPELAGIRSLGLHPLVLAIDECQELFADEKVGKEAAALCTAVIKRGRALGIILLLATQRPDRESLPTAISANVGTRFCLRVMGQTENDMVLGTSSYKNGIRATSFVKADKGIGYLVGAGDDPQIVRTYYIDNVAAEAISERALAARIAAGTLTGLAAGQTRDSRRSGSSLSEDILAVVPSSESKVWSEIVVARLAELRSELYEGWGPDQLATALKPLGVDTVQISRRIDGKVVNRRGIERSQIARLVAERSAKQVV